MLIVHALDSSPLGASHMKLAPLLLVASFCAGTAHAGDLFAYPPAGRAAEQQQQDKYECHQWAVEQSSFDPVQLASTPAVTPASGNPAPQGTNRNSGSAA